MSPATAASTLNIVYKEEYYSDGANNNNNEEDLCENDAASGQEYILVTLDDNQSLDTLISNLNQVMRNTEYVVVETGDSLLKHAVVRAEEEEEEESSPPPPSELIWAGGSDGESRVISDDEDVGNSHHHDQIIYVNSEDVSSEPAEQFIVLESE